MNEFTISGEGDLIKFTFEEVYGFPDSTSFKGGYDVLAKVEIRSGNFQVTSLLYTSTGEIYQLYRHFKNCSQNLFGKAYFKTHEGNLNFFVEYDNIGHVLVKGTFSGQSGRENEFKFEFISDQSFIQSAIKELELIVGEYGDMTGKKISS